VHSSIAGPCIFVLSEGFLIDISSISGPNGAWPLRFDPVDNGWIVATQRDEQLLFTSTCAETLPLSKVTGLSRWRHAPLQEWARRTSSVPLPGVRPHDRTPKPWGRGAIRSATPTGAASQMLRQIEPGVKLSRAKIPAAPPRFHRLPGKSRPPSQALVLRYRLRSGSWVMAQQSTKRYGLERSLRRTEIPARTPRLGPTATA
jgi:hypothetical protein